MQTASKPSRTVNGTASYLYYNGWNLIEEDNSAGAAQLLYVHGPATDELAAMWSASSNSWNWYHYDARGSVTHLTNASGQLVEQYSYSAFGVPSYFSSTGHFSTPQLWAIGSSSKGATGSRNWASTIIGTGCICLFLLNESCFRGRAMAIR